MEIGTLIIIFMAVLAGTGVGCAYWYAEKDRD